MAVEFIKEKAGKSLSHSAYKIVELIEQKGNASASELTNELDISNRTIHYSLKKLMEANYINKTPFLHDMRQTRYSINRAFIEKLRVETFQKFK